MNMPSTMKAPGIINWNLKAIEMVYAGGQKILLGIKYKGIFSDRQSIDNDRLFHNGLAPIQGWGLYYLKLHFPGSFIFFTLGKKTPKFVINWF